MKEACPHCKSTEIIRYGHTRHKKQNYLCKSCGKQFSNLTIKEAEPTAQDLDEAQLIRAFQSRMSLRRMSFVFAVSIASLTKFLINQGKDLAILTIQQMDYILENVPTITLECDEMHTFIGKKSEKRWIWIAKDRKTGLIIAYHVGMRDTASCKEFYEKIPLNIRTKARFVTDQWSVYGNILPQSQHFPQDNRGETNHIERFNGTLRAFCSRLVRKSYSFSKKLENLTHHLNIVIFQHNKRTLSPLP